MPIKKSDLYSSLWASCDALRGGMDASQYKDMVALKGKSDIGDRINTQIIQPLIDANARLARSDFPDFNDPNKLGQGKEMVDRLTNLVSIFQKPELDFSQNRAEHDDILGDAYEYLMRHFATESGKSKGQFYTPSEVSRVIAKVIGISSENTRASTTAYDPTCGSGSLLLKVAAEAGKHITLEGQEKDVTTAGLARMNMILHDFPTASILSGNTLANPKFVDGQQLRTYDYVVANPPFSDKTWSTGIPACILVLDKENAAARRGVMMIDASRGFIKDDNKNRPREQDIHRIVDTFQRQVDVPRYARLVPLAEIVDAMNDIDALQAELDAAQASQTEMEEEQGGEEGIFSGYDSITAAAVKERIREIGRDPDGVDEVQLLEQWLARASRIAALKKQLREADAALDDKWMAALEASVQGELNRVSQTLTGRIRELAERYATPLPQLTDEVAALAARVEKHLERMGISWT